MDAEVLGPASGRGPCAACLQQKWVACVNGTGVFVSNELFSSLLYFSFALSIAGNLVGCLCFLRNLN